MMASQALQQPAMTAISSAMVRNSLCRHKNVRPSRISTLIGCRSLVGVTVKFPTKTSSSTAPRWRSRP
jgi:hypothetical protein